MTYDQIFNAALALSEQDKRILIAALEESLPEQLQPAYEPDDGPLTPKQMVALRKHAAPSCVGHVSSSLF
jgi:hypothetical protein